MPSVPSAIRPVSAEDAASAQVLGIGFSYIPTLPADLYRPGLVDFVEITPEMLCRTRRDGEAWSMDLVPDKLERARAVCGEFPTVVHGVELSIGSARHWNDAYLDMLDQFQAIWPFYWHSEHLTYQTIPGDDQQPLSTGVPLPLPGTTEVVHLVRARADAIGVGTVCRFCSKTPRISSRGSLTSRRSVTRSGLWRRLPKAGIAVSFSTSIIYIAMP
jgi:Protein of unknown function (DUF692)